MVKYNEGLQSTSAMIPSGPLAVVVAEELQLQSAPISHRLSTPASAYNTPQARHSKVYNSGRSPNRDVIRASRIISEQLGQGGGLGCSLRMVEKRSLNRKAGPRQSGGNDSASVVPPVPTAWMSVRVALQAAPRASCSSSSRVIGRRPS
jgi:hypothetical protein